jgi:hypothetical protein
MLPVAAIVEGVAPLPAAEDMDLEVMAVEEDAVTPLLKFGVWFRDSMGNIIHVSSK